MTQKIFAIIFQGCFLLFVLLLQSCKDYNEEALAEGKRFFSERLLQCGDSWYGDLGNSIIVEFENITFFVAKSELTKDEKKAGGEWKGYVGVRGTRYRHYEYSLSGFKWSQWQNWTANATIHTNVAPYALGPLTQALVGRQDGKWRSIPASAFGSGGLRSMSPGFSCDKIPKA